MIKSVHIQNFQSHKDSILNFDPGMNVIIGQTDRGKTAIIRSLIWGINNSPGGDSFRSNWGGDTSVEIKTTENIIVTRTKTNKLNSYELNTIEEPFLAFGQNVPEEIKKALNFDSINLQKQLDSPFLLSETSGAVALHFNKIAKLEQIDKSRSLIQSEINSITASIKSNESLIKEKKKELSSFIDIEEWEKQLIRLEKKQKKIDEIYTELSSIESFCDDINEIEGEIIEYQNLIKSEAAIDKLLLNFEKLNKARKEFKELKTISLDLYVNEVKEKKYNTFILAETDINKIIDLYASLKQTQQKSNELSELVDSITTLNIRQENGLKSLKDLEEFYHTNFPDICPLCETKLK